MNTSIKLTTQHQQLVFSLLGLAARIERQLDHSLAAVRGISFTEYQLLRQLSLLNEGSATRIDLANAVHLTPSAITRALKPLEKIGYVETIKSARDARRSMASLTGAGKELLSDADKLVADIIGSLPHPSLSDKVLSKVIKDLA